MKSKETKRTEAQARDKLRAGRSDKEQLRWLDKGGFAAVRERARLSDRIFEAAQAAAEAKRKKKGKREE